MVHVNVEHSITKNIVLPVAIELDNARCTDVVPRQSTNDVIMTRCFYRNESVT